MHTATLCVKLVEVDYESEHDADLDVKSQDHHTQPSLSQQSTAMFSSRKRHFTGQLTYSILARLVLLAMFSSNCFYKNSKHRLHPDFYYRQNDQNNPAEFPHKPIPSPRYSHVTREKPGAKYDAFWATLQVQITVKYSCIYDYIAHKSRRASSTER